ncbi:KH domain protein [Ancylostoma caninum]|uniref:KH domain protein n=1 Tax=Ancylostoma caninum TaxID=29170 RepID=A0A368G414_ANCCA|nr:KH domain protein [Ancylostoma caninum]
MKESTPPVYISDGETSASSTPVDVVQMDYSTDFPKLPEAAPAAAKPLGAWSRPAVGTKTIVHSFILAADERANKVKSFPGNTSEEHKKCQAVAAATGTRIELSESKDGALTVVIKGLRAKVEDARARLVRDLQTQASRDLDIPKDHHRKLIGKEGAALRQLEADTNCRIAIPSRDTPSETIKITGPREGIEKAVAYIKSVSERESKLATEHIVCPRIFYPFVRGPFNEIYDKLTQETGAKINIPPSQANNEVIVVTGEKEGVHKAAAVIRGIVADKQATAKSVTCTVAKAQHRYIIGQQRSGLHTILKETGVSVEVPNEDENSDTITLRGDPSKLGEALALVYQRASSVITQQIVAPTWLHKHIIGPKGSTLQNLIPNRGKVQIDFEDSGTIFLEGAPEEVKAAHSILSEEVARLQKEMSIEKVKVHPSLHRHVIGRGGALISKIKDETGVQISIPNEQTNSDEIIVEGKKEGVKKAVEEIRAIVSKIENEKSRDIIIEQRLHKLIIGTKGENIGKIREAHPNVVLSFPDVNKKSDVINIRGDKTEVDKVYKQLQSLAKDLAESNYQQTVPIFKEFHKHIIGKGGATIKKIREETQTRIDLPEVIIICLGDSGEERITVTGKKANVEKAIDQLNKIQNELASIVTVEVDIPVKVQARLLGNGRRLISDIEEECGGVHIRFPAEKSESTKVTIRGPKSDVERAQKLLTDLAKDKEVNLHEATVVAKPEFHRFLIGKGGSKINKMRENYDVRVMFPRETDADKETIHLLGKKEDVLKVKKELEENIKQLNETVESTIEVDTKHHRHFVMRGAAVLREIQEQNGGVVISFPKMGTDSTTVHIKGSKQCVESAKARIEEIVEDIEKQVSIQVEIPSQFHRALLVNRGQKIQDLQSKHGVLIRFPERRLGTGKVLQKCRCKHREISSFVVSEPTEDFDSHAADMVTISGRDTKCEAAKQELLSMVPVSRVINVPIEMHRGLIGRGGETVRKMMQDFDVNISIPKNNESEEITVTGQSQNVEEALERIREKIAEFEAQAEDRKLRSFQLVIEVPAEYHTRVIGPRGATVNALRAKHDVQISLPRGEEKSDQITIQGYEAAARACAAEIDEMIEEIRSMFTQEVSIDAGFHPRMIGVRGKNLKKLMEDFGVEIRFPRDAADPNLVIIAGKSEDAVYDCIDHLRAEEEEYLVDHVDRNQYISTRVQEPPKVNKPVQISNAPWQLDIGSSEHFPDMGAAAPSHVVGGAWGSARRW